MKKKIIFLLIGTFFLLFSLWGCEMNKSTEILFLDELVQCDLIESGNQFGFNLIYLYKGEKPDVEFVSFDDNNIDAMFIEMIDDTMESITDEQYKDYKAIILGFCFDISAMEIGEQMEINSIRLLVNGKEQTLNTEGQIKLVKVSDEDERYYCSSVYSTNVPVILFSQGKKLEYVSFNYHTETDVVIDNFALNNFVQITNSMVYIDGVEKGTVEEVFPLEVGEDQTINIIIDGDFGEYDSFSDFYLNSGLYYHNDKEGEKILKDYLAIQAVGNFDDLKNLIEHIVTEE